MDQRPTPGRMGSMAAAGLLAAASLPGHGCADPASAVGFDEPDPAARIRAIRRAGADTSGDRASLRPLIETLDSDDSAERMLAIRALEHRTGQTMGYEHGAPVAERRRAARKWVDWYEHPAAVGGAGGEGPGAGSAGGS